MEEWTELLLSNDIKGCVAFIDSIDLSQVLPTESEELLSSLLIEVYRNFPLPPYGIMNMESDVITTDESINYPGDARLIETNDDIANQPFNIKNVILYLLGHFEQERLVQTRDVPMMILVSTFRSMSPTAISYVYMVNNLDLMTVLLDMPRCLPQDQTLETLELIVRIFNRANPLYAYDQIYNPDSGLKLHQIINVAGLELLMAIADQFQHTPMYNWLLDEYRNVSPTRKAPEWMLDDVGIVIEEKLISTTDIDFDAEATKICEEWLDPLLVDRAVPIAEANMRISTTRQLLEQNNIIDGRFPSEDDEIRLFRLYGPSNPFGVDPENEMSEGQDRMLLCDTYNMDIEEDEYPIFRGTCDYCGYKIISSRHVIRLPVQGGGWYGSYCRLECAQDSLVDSRSSHVTQLNHEAVASALEKCYEQLLQYGIHTSTKT